MFYYIFVFLVLTIKSGFICAGSQKFRCDYTYDSDSDRWYKLHRIPANWHEAQLRCYLEGGVLASPLNLQINEFMLRIMNNSSIECGVFTGIHATFSRGDFFSVEGIPLESVPHTWAKDEPDNINDEESCIIMLPHGLLADVDCKQPHTYICYKKNTTNMVWNQACGTSDPAYTYDARTSHCYKFHRVPRTWSRAYMACAAEGAYLAIINSEAEAAVIKEVYAKNPDSSMLGNFNKGWAFMGFHDWNEHGDWRTIEGETLAQAGYNRWPGGQPDNATTGEFCGAVWRSGLLDDLWCENHYAFICEKKPDSLCPITDDESDHDH